MSGEILVGDVNRDTATEGQRKSDVDDKNGQPQSGSATCATRMRREKTSLTINGKERPLEPSMAVIAEFKRGSRRIIDHLLSLMKAYQQGSFTGR